VKDAPSLHNDLSSPASGNPPTRIRWCSIRSAARALDVSRPHFYNLIDRFGIKTVSLAEKGKTGSRFVDLESLEEVMNRLAEEQVGRPRICNKKQGAAGKAAFKTKATNPT